MTSKPTSLDVPRLDSGWATSVASTVAGDEYTNEKVPGSNASDNEKHDDATVTSQQPTQDEEEYPSGMKMFFIVVALVCSIFLLSLDMVRLHSDRLVWLQSLTLKYSKTHNKLSRLSLPLLSQRSPKSLKALIKLGGTVPPSL